MPRAFLFVQVVAVACVEFELGPPALDFCFCFILRVHLSVDVHMSSRRRCWKPLHPHGDAFIGKYIYSNTYNKQVQSFMCLYH